MNIILDQLVALSGRLVLPTGVPETSLKTLRVFLTASLVQQNPGALPIQPEPTLDAEINEDVARGVNLAAKFAESSTRVRVLRDSYASPATTPEQPTRVFGPFVDFDGSLVQFSVYESTPFLKVQVIVPAPFALATEILMLLPAESFSEDGNLTFAIPEGTVWLRSRLLVPNTTGYVGLRVTQGILKTDLPATPAQLRHLSLPFNAQWSLTLETEQPAPADGNSSDANAINLRVPRRLEVFSTGESRVNGRIVLNGFGSDLEFRNPLGQPFADATSVSFPFDSAGASWAINGNLSNAAQVVGESRVLSPAWTLPLNKLPLDTFGEASHGGSVKIRLRESFESRMLGAAGTFKWFDSTLIVNALGVSLEASQAESSARSELDLWTPAHSDAVFAQESIGRLLFYSLRDGRDCALVRGGEIRNQWDLPLTAAGKPFAYKGKSELFAVIAEPSGLFRIACTATQQPDNTSHGVALENLYLMVRPPRRLSFTGDYDGLIEISNGVAVFFFDVMLAQPSLPDPYIANWSLSDERFISEAALSITLRWLGVETPSVIANLERPVSFPEPREIVPDEPVSLRLLFDHHLETQFEPLNLLDLSSNDHHFGVALERLGDQHVRLRDNRLHVELRDVRLLMQPQVQWEPVDVVPYADAGVPHPDLLFFKTNGARTLAGAASVKLVPVLPGMVSLDFIAAAGQRLACGVLFSLPFGLRAFARFDRIFERVAFQVRPPIATTVHEPQFGALTSARQLRLIATGALNLDPKKDPAGRAMTGAMVQLENLEQPNKNKLPGVLSAGIDKDGVPILTGGVDSFLKTLGDLPLHQADLSGYGLSTFSNWHCDVPTGITKVRFDVLNGRTSYEVIQAKTILVFPLCYAVRTIIFERRNSGKVLRFDSGWQPINDGEFKAEFEGNLADPFIAQRNFEFEKGVVKAFRNIRRIRVLTDPSLTVPDPSSGKNVIWQPVIFDADAHLESVVAGGAGGLVPIYDHPGYIQIEPTGKGSEITRVRIEQLLKQIGKPVGGGVDCKIRAGGTLEMQLSGIFADEASDDAGLNTALILAGYGSPKLPRAGQWSAVRINGATSEASPVDPRHGIPLIRRTGQPTYIFREPGEANRSKPDEFGFLMSTATSRVLFPKPTINPGEAGSLRTAPPYVADPYSLVQSTSQFPRASYALSCAQSPLFNINADNQWQLTNSNFSVTPPAPDLAKGGEWAMTRAFPGVPSVDVLVDSISQNKPWDIGTTPNDLNVNIDGLGTVFVIHTNYHAVSGALPKLEKPTLDFGKALDDVKEIIDSLKNFAGPVFGKFNFDVDVTAGTGPSPSFLVRIGLKFRLGEGPNERIDIGVGKFYGEFRIRGELETALSGKTRGLLSAEFEGDVQQGIIPPAIYAGGMFRFAISITETGKPLIELGLGATASLGGDLIKGLLEVEVTVKYGYTLIPQTLQPGVLLGLEARAKILGGLVGFSFSVEAMARIKRVDIDKNQIDIWAKIRVAATVQVAWLVEEEVDFETQFEQRLPLRLIVAAQFFPALLPAAALL